LVPPVTPARRKDIHQSLIIGPNPADDGNEATKGAAMDWTMIIAVMLGGWVLLSVLSSERITRHKQIADAITAAKAAAADQAMKL
jgi:hypothetical protein